MPVVDDVSRLHHILEAAGGVFEGLRSKYLEIAWRQMSAMRNRLIHGYFEVNLDTVWETVVRELPPLIGQLRKVLDNETK